MSQQQIEKKQLRTVFDKFDLDKSGFIELNEIKSVVQEMGQTMTQDQIKKVVLDMDTNGDGKISFDEFQFWWTHSKMGKFKNLVKLKFKALKLISKASSKLDQSSIKLKEQFTKELTSHELKLTFGDDKGQFQFETQFFLLGQLFKQQYAALQKIVTDLKQSKISCILTINTKDPATAKSELDKLLSAMDNFPGSSTIQEIHSLMQFKTIAKQGKLFIVIRNKTDQQLVDNVLDTPTSIIDSVPQLSIHGQLAIKLKSGIEQAFNNMKFVKWLFEGLSVKLKVEANSGLMKSIRQMLLGGLTGRNLAFGMVTLLHSTKFNFKLKNPEDVNKLFESLGINSLSEDTPTITQLLKEISTQSQLETWKSQKTENGEPNEKHLYFKILEYLNQVAQDTVLVDLVFSFCILRFRIKAPGGSQIFKHAFNIN